MSFWSRGKIYFVAQLQLQLFSSQMFVFPFCLPTFFRAHLKKTEAVCLILCHSLGVFLETSASLNCHWDIWDDKGATFLRTAAIDKCPHSETLRSLSISSFCGPNVCVYFFSWLIWISSFTTIRHLTVFSKNLMKAIKSIGVGDGYANTEDEKTEESYLYGNVYTLLCLRELLIKRGCIIQSGSSVLIWLL